MTLLGEVRRAGELPRSTFHELTHLTGHTLRLKYAGGSVLALAKEVVMPVVNGLKVSAPVKVS